MNHPDEKILELYILGAKQDPDQRSAIETHLKGCDGCSALFREMKQYYGDVAVLQEQKDRALTLRSMIVSVPPFVRAGVLHETPKTLPARVVLFVMKHPAIASISLFAMALGMVLLMVPRSVEKDANPSYARAKNEFLIVYNKNGEELWRKHVGVAYDVEKFLYQLSQNPERALTTVDVDGDGKNEVLAIFGWTEFPPGISLKNTIMCYNADGTERWRYEFHRQMTFGKKSFSDDYKVVLMMAGDFDRDGKCEVVAAVWHTPSWPCAIIRLDAATGALTGEFWHAGWLHSVDHKDIDGDGVEELLFAGENNAFNLASIVVLDPRTIEGYAPATNEYIPEGVKTGRDKYFLLFPRSDVGTLAPHPRNVATELNLKSDGSTEVNFGERFSNSESYNLYTYFDGSMKCIRVIPNDDFILFHRRMEAEGKLSKKIDDKYLEELRQGFQYWNGEKFVHEPTMNKRYLETLENQPLP